MVILRHIWIISWLPYCKLVCQMLSKCCVRKFTVNIWYVLKGPHHNALGISNFSLTAPRVVVNQHFCQSNFLLDISNNPYSVEVTIRGLTIVTVSMTMSMATLNGFEVHVAKDVGVDNFQFQKVCFQDKENHEWRNKLWSIYLIPRNETIYILTPNKKSHTFRLIYCNSGLYHQGKVNESCLCDKEDWQWWDS